MKKKKPTDTSANRKQSGESLQCSSSLKEQVEQVKVLAEDALDKLASDPNITFCEFVIKTRQINQAFKIMETALQLSEQMKKLKEK